MPRLSRRGFIASSAIGVFVLGFPLARGRAGGSPTIPVNAWLAISVDGDATILCPSAEMGQGVYSTLPAIVAEELKMPWDKVRVEIAPNAPTFANPVIGLHATFESTSVRGHFQPLRLAGATAREMLVRAAAERWGVPMAECEASAGRVENRSSGRSLGYGELAEAAARLDPPAEPRLTALSDWRLLGTRLPRKDTPPKVDGSAGYGMDVRRPRMLTGAVAMCPIVGGTLRDIDQAPALAIDGVRRVVRLPDAVVVLADNYWTARKGLEALEPHWDAPAGPELDDAAIGRRLSEAVASPAIYTEEADEGVDAALAAPTGRLIEAEYEVPYLAHATMEPMNATALFGEDKIEIWAPTQAPQLAQFAVAGAFQRDPASIVVNSTFLGGGFGRRSETDFIVQAVAVSREAGVPVKVIWSREEDTRHDFYRPRARARLTARLSENGRIEAWRGRFACQSIMIRLQPDSIRNRIDDTSIEGAFHLPYDLGLRRTEYALIDDGLPVGFWRSPGHNQNAFFTEGFIDELAEAAGQDPLTFRLGLLAQRPRHRTVLERAAQMIGWGMPREGHHLGLALHESHGSIAAEGIDIEWFGDGRFRIERISCAIDCGIALNPDTIEAQMESGIVYALSAALEGEINVEGGRVRQANFNDYPVLRLAQMPSIDVAIIEGGDAPGGIGEPSTPPLAPALASALHAASGRRVRETPFSKHGFRLTDRAASES